MTHWKSLPLTRNASKRCICYDCMRDQGITVNGRPDSLGRIRDEKDGRFLAFIAHTEKTKDGEVVTVIDQNRTPVR
jgi:hypothetical protein